MTVLGRTPLGYDVLSYGDSRLGTFAVPGASAVKLSLYRPTAPIILAVTRDFNAEVETLRPADTGAHNPRHIDNDPDLPWSNHGSGTAVDCNWQRHPLGAVNTFTPAQRDAIHRIIRRYTMPGVGPLVRWGGDYTGRKDEMHFEIIQEESDALRGVTWLQSGGTVTLVGDDKKFIQDAVLTALIPNGTGDTLGILAAQLAARTKFLATTNVATELAAIKAAALDAADNTVVMDPAVITKLDSVLTLISGLPDEDAIADAVVAKLPDGAEVTDEEVKAAVKAALREGVGGASTPA